MTVLKLTILLISIFDFSCCGKKVDQKEISSKNQQILKKFTAFESVKGKKNWELKADQAEIFETEKVALLKNFKVIFYNENQKIKSVLQANNGKIDTTKNDFYTIGWTTITNYENEVLFCNDLKYLSDKKRFFTDSTVKIIKHDSILTGIGLEATPDMNTIIIKKNRIEINK